MKNIIKKHKIKIIIIVLIVSCILEGVYILVKKDKQLETLAVEELKEEVLEKNKNLTFEEWEDKINYRGLEHKYDYQLEEAKDLYPKKINKMIESYNQNPEAVEKQYLIEKIDRLKDKYAATLKELEFRETGKAKREPIGTTYYIDFDNGDDTNDGLSTSTSWKTLTKYTTDTIRSAGDIAYIRAGTTFNSSSSDINLDEDGALHNNIIIKGCSSSDDPWADGSDTKPIITFEDQAYQFYLYYDTYWTFKNLDIQGSGDATGGAIRIDGGGHFFVLDNCDIHNNTVHGMSIQYGNPEVKIKNSSFYSNAGRNLYLNGGPYYVENCTFNGGASTTDYGIYTNGATIDIKDSTFGVTTGHDTNDIYVTGSIVRGRNLNLATANKEVSVNGTDDQVRMEDYQQVKGDHKTWYINGTITKDTGLTRSGGANSSAKMETNSSCGSDWPLTLTNDWLAGDFRVWHSATGTNATATIYMTTAHAWTATPTASQFYIQTEYYDTVGSASRATSTPSTQTLANATGTWTAFTTSYTPNETGWAYIYVYLKKHEANGNVYVDIKSVVEQ